MAKSLSRQFFSVVNLSAARLTSPVCESESLARSVVGSATRFLSSSNEEPRENPNGRREDVAKEIQSEREDAERDDGDGDDDEEENVNKETGEIGGPRGPEPTRYGDWERNGRCYDF